MYVFCCGMHRSGSTWHYMVASHLIETRKGGRRLGLMDKENEFLDYDKSPDKFEGWQILKMHTPRQVFAEALRGGALAIYSYRDLRDAVFSLIKFRETTFEEFVVRRDGLGELVEHDRFWRRQPATLSQRYEDIMQRPADCIAQIALHLEVPLQAGEAESLAAQFSLSENMKRAVAVKKQRENLWPNLFLKPRSFDSQSLLHWNHIQSGKTGRWRDEATPEQIQHLARILGAWLIERGYETNLDWAKTPPAATAKASAPDAQPWKT